MPPKAAEGPKAKKKPQEEQKDDLLQAVVREPEGSLYIHSSVSDLRRSSLILSKPALRLLPLNGQE